MLHKKNSQWPNFALRCSCCSCRLPLYLLLWLLALVGHCFPLLLPFYFAFFCSWPGSSLPMRMRGRGTCSLQITEIMPTLLLPILLFSSTFTPASNKIIEYRNRSNLLEEDKFPKNVLAIGAFGQCKNVRRTWNCSSLSFHGSEFSLPAARYGKLPFPIQWEREQYCLDIVIWIMVLCWNLTTEFGTWDRRTNKIVLYKFLSLWQHKPL